MNLYFLQGLFKNHQGGPKRQIKLRLFAAKTTPEGSRGHQKPRFEAILQRMTGEANQPHLQAGQPTGGASRHPLQVYFDGMASSVLWNLLE